MLEARNRMIELIPSARVHHEPTAARAKSRQAVERMLEAALRSWKASFFI
jgi:hypothetical protein